ncbi:hypothetical protein E2C01_060310 [Portunus trituberculatus]|uniref:Uncharacterized protein n=1 Tax=Portunus trituberculatus TaxID=210409 RepID=A0A5B7HBQ1_PORTR|nr:hypothetical protein [Portunus trituberculatus]
MTVTVVVTVAMMMMRGVVRTWVVKGDGGWWLNTTRVRPGCGVQNGACVGGVVVVVVVAVVVATVATTGGTQHTYCQQTGLACSRREEVSYSEESRLLEELYFQ